MLPHSRKTCRETSVADGASDKLVRDVTENCRTLKFTDFGFEEE